MCGYYSRKYGTYLSPSLHFSIQKNAQVLMKPFLNTEKCCDFIQAQTWPSTNTAVYYFVIAFSSIQESFSVILLCLNLVLFE